MTNDPAHLGPKSTPALISYALIIYSALIVFSVFALIVIGVRVQEFMSSIVGGIVSTSSTVLGAVAGFWLAGMNGPNRKEPNKTDVIETRIESSTTESK